MIFRLELEVPEHVPPPARFVFCRLFVLDPGNPRLFEADPAAPRRLAGALSLDEDTARALAEVINGEPWPAREWHSPYGDDDDLDDDAGGGAGGGGEPEP